MRIVNVSTFTYVQCCFSVKALIAPCPDGCLLNGSSYLTLMTDSITTSDSMRSPVRSASRRTSPRILTLPRLTYPKTCSRPRFRWPQSRPWSIVCGGIAPEARSYPKIPPWRASRTLAPSLNDPQWRRRGVRRSEKQRMRWVVRSTVVFPVAVVGLRADREIVPFGDSWRRIVVENR